MFTHFATHTPPRTGFFDHCPGGRQWHVPKFRLAGDSTVVNLLIYH